ncbi:Hypothetical protein A7982_04985 [Minicystis rosea]|nr:Hypothetical protein A7982_04985 [Minicystis rosea]
MKNVAFRLSGRYLICAYNEYPPTDEEAKASLEIFKTLNFETVKVLTFTKGGAPTASQRKELNDALAGRQLTTAVVSDSPLLRGIITAFSWFNPKIKAFNSSELEQAFLYLEIPPSRWERIAEESAKVQAEVDKPRPSSRPAAGPSSRPGGPSSRPSSPSSSRPSSPSSRPVGPKRA